MTTTPCPICSIEFNSLKSLSMHLGATHKLDAKAKLLSLGVKQRYCEYCGKETQAGKKDFKKYCSIDCFKADKDNVIAKRQAVWSSRDEAKQKQIKENISKALRGRKQTEHQRSVNPFCKSGQPAVKQAMLEKYGVDNCQKLQQVQEKTKQTCLETMGVAYAIHGEASKQAIKDKYGVDNISQVPEIQAKIRISLEKTNRNLRYNRFINNKNSWKDNVDILSSLEEYIETGELKCYCKHCKKEFSNLQNKLATPRCYDCCPKKLHSKEELVLRNFLEQYDDNIAAKDRTMIAPLELDIYFPSRKIAIEYNGVYWHTTEYKEPKYHLEKTLLAKEKNIRLVHVWEDQWLEKRSIVESRLKSLFGITARLMARKCKLVKPDKNTAKAFFEENHLQGNIKRSASYYGLTYEDKLVALASFGNLRYKSGADEESHKELYRFCCKNDYSVAGALSKLCKEYIKETNATKLISYCSRDWGDGHGYEAAGFIKVGETPPNYSYFYRGKRISREHFMKHKLKNLFPESYDEAKTEIQIMESMGYFQIFDCGNIKYEMTT